MAEDGLQVSGKVDTPNVEAGGSVVAPCAVPAATVANMGSGFVTKDGSSGKKLAWVSLFSNNRTFVDSFKLGKDGHIAAPIHLRNLDVDDLQSCWGHCIVGFLAGRFPGRDSFDKLMKLWGVQSKLIIHSSGWVMFKFKEEEDKIKVLGNGPYAIFGRPLIIKDMPPFFDFDDKFLSIVPCWINLPGLPLECWNSRALSKIASSVGTPIAMDRLTAERERISYARVLVEVDTSGPIVDNLEIYLPNGDKRNQCVKFETIPCFCTRCKRVGHELKDCIVLLPAQRNPRGRSSSHMGRKSRDHSRVQTLRKDGQPSSSGTKSMEPIAGESCQEPSRIEVVGAESECTPVGTSVDVAANQVPRPVDVAVARVPRSTDPVPRPAAMAEAGLSWPAPDVAATSASASVANAQVPSAGEMVEPRITDVVKVPVNRPKSVAEGVGGSSTKMPMGNIEEPIARIDVESRNTDDVEVPVKQPVMDQATFTAKYLEFTREGFLFAYGAGADLEVVAATVYKATPAGEHGALLQKSWERRIQKSAQVQCSRDKGYIVESRGGSAALTNKAPTAINLVEVPVLNEDTRTEAEDSIQSEQEGQRDRGSTLIDTELQVAFDDEGFTPVSRGGRSNNGRRGRGGRGRRGR